MTGRFRRLFQLRPRTARDVAQDVEDEIRAHLAMRVEELQRRGWDAAGAEAEALRRFGDVSDARRRLRATAAEREARVRRREWWSDLRDDARFAWRQARRAPAMAAVALVTFALATGATTAIFSVVDHVVFRPLPLAQPERLVALGSVDSAGTGFNLVSMANWMDWRAGTRTLASTALYTWAGPVAARGAEGTERVRVAVASGAFFATLRPPMVAGRGFTEEEAASGAEVAVVREGYWRRALGADPRLAAPLRLGGRDFTVVGVVRDDAALPADAEVWHPIRVRPGSGAVRNNVSYYAVARLAPGATVERARADLTAIAHGIRASDPAGIYSHGVQVRPLREELLGESGEPLVLLLAAVAVVLLIACANLASANLARGAARAAELSVRAALGAGRRRLVQQLLVEQLCLALAGGVLGVPLAWWLVRVLVTVGGERLPRAHEVAVDGRVLAVALLVTVAAGLLSGALPALRLSRVSLRERMGTSRTGRTSANGLGRALVAGELALALTLLAGAGLLARNLLALTARDLGYVTDGVVTIDASLEGSSHGRDGAAVDAYWARALDAARGVPGVAAAGISSAIPLDVPAAGFVDFDHRPSGTDGAGYRVISDGYLETLGIPLLAGRTFRAGDGEGAGVTLVNEAMAEAYWPGESPIGRRVRARSMEGNVDGEAPWLTVVGVVGDVRHFGYESEPQPEMYVPVAQTVRRWGYTAVVRLAAPPAQVLPLLRERLRAMDPTVALELGRLDRAVARSLGGQLFPASVLGGFSLLALLLAATGLYGVLSFAVAQRSRELAIRAALGAERGRLMRLVLGDASRVLAVGVVAGLAATLYLTRFLETLLVEVERGDAIALGAATALLVAVGLVAAYVPTRRATRVDPIVAMRAE